MTNKYPLTQYSHGAGCGCKIAPEVLDQMLAAAGKEPLAFKGLLVGNQERDDAAVMDLGDGTAIISTTDFFMPIVDDPIDFGRIAAVNAISDIYAMGGKPLLAIAILGWPVNSVPADVAGKVLEGGRIACTEAGIPLAGGHSIDSPEPIFGLAVTGRIDLEHLKRNGGARPGDLLFLTKPLGVGILSTAQKKGLLAQEHATLARDSMIQLNTIGLKLATVEGVHAMTDVTGFGLLGHLKEMMQASSTSAILMMKDIPLLESTILENYLNQGCIPGGTQRNYASYGESIGGLTERQRQLLCDPQTSGGILVAVEPSREKEVIKILQINNLPSQPIGQVVDSAKWLIEVL